jgi:hypothetical protein
LIRRLIHLRPIFKSAATKGAALSGLKGSKFKVQSSKFKVQGSRFKEIIASVSAISMIREWFGKLYVIKPGFSIDCGGLGFA